MSDAEMEEAARVFRDFTRKRGNVCDYSDRRVPRALIENCIVAAETAPSGANHQPGYFVAISDPAAKQKIQDTAEEQERRFYDGGAGDEWLQALELIGTGVGKPHLGPHS